jgi:hypothetical protein
VWKNEFNAKTTQHHFYLFFPALCVVLTKTHRNQPHAVNGAASSAPAAATPHAAPAAVPQADPAAAAPAAVSAPSQDAPEPVWDLKNFKLFETVRGSQAECIVSDDKLLYSGSSDGSLGIWDPVGLKHLGNFKVFFFFFYIVFIII